MGLIAFLSVAALSMFAFAQGGEAEPTSMEYVALLANVGAVAALVQLMKWKVIPSLKAKAPYLIPIIGMAIGTLGAWVFAKTGIDISPIGDIFGAGIISGALASAGFAVAKEFQNTAKGMQ